MAIIHYPLSIINYNSLPASAVIAPLLDALQQGHTAVVTAPPGAGKSTLLPLALLSSIPAGEKILLLEPRRLAARHIATRMAEMLGEEVGQTVGYRVRKDTCISPATRLEVLTEGILTRMLIADPTLSGVAIVIFDEFHERNLNTDEALAFTRHIQSLLRPDLRLVVMSATIDAQPLCQALQAPLIESSGRLFPVSIIHADQPDPHLLPEAMARTILQALRNHEGDLLAFLPGEWEILRTQELLDSALPVLEAELASKNEDSLKNEVSPNAPHPHGHYPLSIVHYPLYSRLSPAEQRRALAPAAPGTRKVVLATPVAETSLTIEGVRIVVDSGFCRQPVYDPAKGLSRLQTVRISLDMADQRAGRAGRLAPGVCYRLYTLATESRMESHRRPEIASADLASLVLDTAALGEEITSLPWLTLPPQGNVSQARQLLQLLDALDPQGRITPIGRRLHRLPCHPRLAHLQLQASTPEECRLASQLTDTLEGLNRLPIPATYAAGRLLAAAYPERIYKQGPDWYVAAEMAGERPVTSAPLHDDDLTPYIRTREVVRWDVKQAALIAQTERRVGGTLLASSPLPAPSREAILSAICAAAQKDHLSMFDFSDALRLLQQRLRCVNEWHPELLLPDASDAALVASIASWLPLYLPPQGPIRLQAISLAEVLWARLSYEQQLAVERLAPTHIIVPTGSRIRIDYRPGAEHPILSVRLQECFGLTVTPTVDDGQRTVLLELLSPGFKPVQLTSDLPSFWQSTYFEVRKELRRRYPKHSWPDDPLIAPPVRGVQRKP